MASCGGCGLAVQDKFIFYVLDKPWHGACLRCADCELPQTEKCYFRDGLILCRQDFNRRFAMRCAGCKGILERQEMVRRARDLVFHVHCFQCTVCQRPLETGDQLFVVGDNRFICKDDYFSCSKSSASVGSEEVGSDLDEEPEDVSEERDCSVDDTMNSTEGHSGNEGNEDASTVKSEENALCQKRRGPRTTIKAKQLDTLKAAFAATPKPTRHIREQLAHETGLNMRVIQVWFQNRRSKERRLKQLRHNGACRATRRGRQPAGRDDMDASNCCEYSPIERFQSPYFMQPQPPMTFFPELYPTMPPMPMPPALTSGEHGPSLPACTVPSAAPYNGMESVPRLQGVHDSHTDADMSSAQNLWVNDFKM